MSQHPGFTYTGRIHPPYSTVVTLTSPASSGAVFKKIMIGLLVAFFIGGVLITGGVKEELDWLLYTGIGVGVLIVAISIYMAMTAQKANCPYCNAMLGDTASLTLNPTDDNEQIECPVCFEWLVSHQGTLRAFTQADIGKKTEFDCPVFMFANWPQECIVCGAPAVRFLQAKRTKLEAGKLLIGKISVSWGSINNIPYCGFHHDAVGVNMRDSFLRAVFYDYDMRRRFLAVNSVRRPVKKKGLGT
ncbi:MAG: Uncharacterized protein FD123_3559 [Bacteroidetes bacterium]|nr:MAG: Uncharacterized protein FD123_3559 [Bacteroidota bacterium]